MRQTSGALMTVFVAGVVKVKMPSSMLLTDSKEIHVEMAMKQLTADDQIDENLESSLTASVTESEDRDDIHRSDGQEQAKHTLDEISQVSRAFHPSSMCNSVRCQKVRPHCISFEGVLAC